MQRMLNASKKTTLKDQQQQQTNQWVLTPKQLNLVGSKILFNIEFFPDTPHIRKIVHHPPHILDAKDGTLSPSSFIPFCSFAGNWNVTGEYTDLFSIPVCNIFKETMVEGQLCYQADLDRVRDEVEREKIVSEGFVFLMDYNEDRMVEVSGMDQNMEEGSSLLGKKKSHEDAMIYVETVGKK